MKRLVIALLLLGGCTGVDGETYIGRPGSPAWFSTASPSTIAGYYQDQCSAYGYRVGTPEMMQCVQMAANTGRQDAEMRRASSAAGLAMASGILAQNNQVRPPLRCTTTQSGPFANTTCY